MQSKSMAPVARMFICLGLATMGFQQELAVTMKNGKRVLLRPVDVCTQIGIRREHFRRYMAELESLGLAECRGAKKGEIEIYAWAVPRSIDPTKIKAVPVDNPEIVCEDGQPISNTIFSTLKHLRIPAGFIASRKDFDHLERLVQETKAAELSLRKQVECLRGKRPYKRRKETAINIERNDEPVAAELELRSVRPSTTSSFSAIEEKLASWLTAHTEQFGLFLAPDTFVVRQIVAHITDGAIFDRFKKQTLRQILNKRIKPDSWMYFVSIAKACAEAQRVAGVLTTSAEVKALVPPGFDQAAVRRLGDGSLESFRETTCNSQATLEDLAEAMRSLQREFEMF